MSRSQIIYSIVLSLLITFGTNVSLGQEPKPATRPASKPATNHTKSASLPFQAGVALSLHSSDPKKKYHQEIREIKALGSTNISILFHLYQDNGTSSTPHRHKLRTVRDEIFIDTLKFARKQDLRILVMPIVLLEKPKDDEWRGNLKPDNWNSWTRNYLKHILHFARLSDQCGAETFVVGSEFSSLEDKTESWVTMIKQVRTVFSGKLTYSSNWDHYEHVKFWNKLDFMGISGYYELTESLTPESSELMASWRMVKARILNFRAHAEVKCPLIFTEIGYTSQDGCASKPWNYYLTDKIDLAEQKQCYDAFIAVWKATPDLGGVYFYEWWGKGGPNDNQYTPRNKPAQKSIEGWYKSLKPKAKTAKSAKSQAK